MTEPIKLRIVSREHSESVIRALEEALSLAKRGELTGVVIIGDCPSGAYTNWAGIWSGPVILWAVEVWKQQAVQSALSKSEPAS